MDGKAYINYSYKLRSGGPIPIEPNKFLVQAFGVDKSEVTNWQNTLTLPKSEDFVGASMHGEYVQASFKRLNYLTEDNEQIFQGTTVGKSEFIDEDEMPGGW